MRAWLIFIKERFDPWAYIPMIILFTLVNALYAVIATGSPWSGTVLSLVLLIMLSFFFRMRLFDEIKDYQTDLQVNPTRPLPRGLLNVGQVKSMIFKLVLFELGIAILALGFWPFLFLFGAILYSLLMYREFFMGFFLRPHLTTYAVLHTVVVVFLSFTIWVALTGSVHLDWRTQDVLFLSMNWCFFNLFEFARKSFAREEERVDVLSYSKIFTVTGAVLLTLSQAVIGVGLSLIALSQVHIFEFEFYRNIIFGLLLCYIFVSFDFIFHPNLTAAKRFRMLSGLYMFSHFLLVILMLRNIL